jgi:hypothetical protein
MMQSKNGLAALGVNALRPPDTTISDHAPTINDYLGYDNLHIWEVVNTTTIPTTYAVYLLVGKGYNTLTNIREANWVKFYPATTTDNGGNLISDDGIVAYPDSNANIGVLSGEAYLGNPLYINTYTKNIDANNMMVALKRSIYQPATNNSATEGMYSLAGNNFLFSYGTNNTMLGKNAANLSLNTGSCTDMTAVGQNVLQSIVDGWCNTGLGSSVMTDLVSGNHNFCAGYAAGDVFQTTESGNICLGSYTGVVGDSHTIRIGTQGSVNDWEQDKCYVAGIYNGTVTAAPSGVVIVDADGCLYKSPVTANKVLITDATGTLAGISDTEGYILTAQGAANVPEFKPLTSSGGSVNITYNAVTGSLNLEATGVAALTQLTTDAGTALPLLGDITIAGGELIETDATVANTVTVNLTRGIEGQVVSGVTGAAPIYKTLFCTSGDIVFDYASDPTKIDFIVAGSGGGITHLHGNTGVPATPVGGGVGVSGNKNIATIGTVGDIEVNVTDDVSLLGYLHAVANVETSTGDLVSTIGSLSLPDTTGVGGGEIRFGGVRWISNFGTNNTFIGKQAGNVSLVSSNNTFTGMNSGYGTSSGGSNSGYGYNSLVVNTSGQNNTSCGANSMANAVDLSYNTCLGYGAGSTLSTSGSNSNILIGNNGDASLSNTVKIGTQGTGNAQQNTCYIAGIYDTVLGGAQWVTVDINGKLVGAAGGGGGGGVTSVAGSTNITITGTPTVPIVNLNDWILLPTTNTAGTAGGISINGSRFMHSYRENTFLGHEAGNLTLASTSTFNVGLGEGSLKSLTSTSARNTAAGYNSGTLLASGAGTNTIYGAEALSRATTASSTVAIGYRAGYNITTTGDNNCYLDNQGIAGESNVMRLGTNYVVGSGGSANTYIAAVNTTATPRFVLSASDRIYSDAILPTSGSTLGQILYTTQSGAGVKYGTWGTLTSTGGTISITPSNDTLKTINLEADPSASIAFSAKLSANMPNATGDGTSVQLGLGTAFTESWDIGNDFFPGSAGTRAYFTAPKDGVYFFQVTVYIYNILSTMVRTVVDPVIIQINHLGSPTYFQLMNPVIAYPPGGSPANDQTLFFTQIVRMYTGDTAYFGFSLTTQLGTKTIGIGSLYTTLGGYYIS